MRRWLRPGMRAVDVGASYGVYTVAMARAVGPGGRVWAFEPTPDAADHLRRNLELNSCSQVALHQTAVSDRDGVLNLAVGANSELNAVVAAGAGDQIQVTAVTLDRIAAAQGWAGIDFVKIDIERHELEAIRGAAAFLAANSPLIMLEVMTRQGADMRAFDPLAEMGYGFFRLLPGPLLLVPFDPLDPADPYLLNLFACKQDRAAELAAGGFLVQSAADAPVPAASAWTSFARAAPYAADLCAGWPAKAGFFSRTDVRSYMDALAAFAHYRDAGLGTAERTAWLIRAHRGFAESLDTAPTMSRRMSYARSAWELGWRADAIAALEPGLPRLQQDAASVLMEPFLAPSLRYEQLAAGSRTADWLRCAVIEQYDKLRHRSSIFAGTESLATLDPIRGMSFCSAEVERRLQLERIRRGLQSAPEPAPILCRRSEENLNPQFWSGAERVMRPGRG
ncbi:MAG TPA: FkbM family methyltransferase [Burkholderiales bacterium]|nr:FkbM family methyltransferase [Burkholderiales bacterium]